MQDDEGPGARRRDLDVQPLADPESRLGRVLRPKADGHGARFYTVVARDTVDAEFAAHRQRFLAEQGYSYTIVDSDTITT